MGGRGFESVGRYVMVIEKAFWSNLERYRVGEGRNNNIRFLGWVGRGKGYRRSAIHCRETQCTQENQNIVVIHTSIRLKYLKKLTLKTLEDGKLTLLIWKRNIEQWGNRTHRETKIFRFMCLLLQGPLLLPSSLFLVPLSIKLFPLFLITFA